MRMRQYKFEELSIDSLLSMRAQLDEILRKKAESERSELEQRVEKLKRLTGEQGPSRAKAKSETRYYPPVVPKYQNTAPPYETWSGRGRTPRWLVTALRAGKKVTDFQIKWDRNKRRHS